MNRECLHRIDVAAYILDALSVDERREFERHIGGCAECRHDVAELRAGADALPLAATPLQPPPELKERLMAVVRSEAELLRAASPGADRARPRRRHTPLGSLLTLRRPAALGAALAVLAIVVAGGLALNDNGSDHAHVIAARTTLSGSARARVELADGRARLVVTGMPRPPAGHVYEVWVKRPGRAPRPAGTFFDVSRGGTTTEEVHGDLRGVDRLLVTVEPGPGSASPTSTPIIEAVLT